MSELFTAEMIERDEAEAGVRPVEIGQALATWVAMQMRSGVTVAEAMAAFNATQEVIRVGVERAFWLAIITDGHSDPSKQLLELDGE